VNIISYYTMCWGYKCKLNDSLSDNSSGARAEAFYLCP
jgi:hypothetical protein